jgi:hypothetical protein
MMSGNGQDVNQQRLRPARGAKAGSPARVLLRAGVQVAERERAGVGPREH